MESQKKQIRLDEVTLMRTILALLIVFMHVVFDVKCTLDRSIVDGRL